MKKILNKKFLYIFSIILIILSSTIFLIRHKINLSYKIISKYIILYKTEKQTNFKDISASTLNDINIKDIKYKETSGVSLNLDIYSPTKEVYRSSPVLIFIHGGSWAYGDKSLPDTLLPIFDTFRECGYTVISVDYQLMREKENFEKQISDVKDVIRWVYKNKNTYNFNTSEIGLLGISSGAHLALMAGYSDSSSFTDDPSLRTYPSKVKYIIDFSGPTDLSLLDTTNLNYDLKKIFDSIDDTDEVMSKYNPINYINKDTPDTLIIHSKNDSFVPYLSSEKLYKRCTLEDNVSAKLITLNDAEHDLSSISKNDIISLSKGLIYFILKNSPF
ncbi:alpha/beta hydrolase [Clostridium sp. BJN0001]|uniref:alpha/beta hydrolase n=1 Tax=Clostridium sp. BJN0001 TaxID=2930219 RepID=UPI001FD0A5C3|nr:alpha/beta hydrolase [Clostridium sp. BJN0001]